MNIQRLAVLNEPNDVPDGGERILRPVDRHQCLEHGRPPPVRCEAVAIRRA
jgi:hypothetical protein